MSKIQEIQEALSLETANSAYANHDIIDAYTSDLLSDVMGNAPENSVLITIQGHKNTVAVASLAGIKMIILCNDRQAPGDMLEAAKEHDIAVFSSSKNQYQVSAAVSQVLQ